MVNDLKTQVLSSNEEFITELSKLSDEIFKIYLFK